MPAVENWTRRHACGLSLHLFLATYFPHSTGLTLFSADHVSVIDRIEGSLLNGGRFCNAVYRGFAKTTITELSALWAVLYGYRRYVAVYGAEKSLAKNLIASITQELTENDLLLEDFPEVCQPFRQLEGKAQRANSQTFNGQRTHIVMTGETLVMPTIWHDDDKTECSPASGAIIRARGILGAGRGIKFKRPDGTNARPDFALLDDIQTDESAASSGQVTKRLNLIRRAILKSAGHRNSIACVANVTPIEHDDVVEQLLDPERNPSWDGVRIPMVRKWADAHEAEWLGEYAKLRRGFNRDIPGDQQRAAVEATEYYAAHREVMDAGCVISWDACFDPECELSAVQHAYNLYLDDPPEVFASECQVQPVHNLPAGIVPLDAITITRKINGYPRGTVPLDAVLMTSFVDVHDDLLYWMVVAWRSDCSGYIVDYGTYPDQKRAYFSKRQANRTLPKAFPNVGREGAISEGLRNVAHLLCGREWQREDGSPVRIAKLLTDTGYHPDEAELVQRTSPHAAVMQLSRGVGIGATSDPISEYRRRPGRQIGEQWYIDTPAKRSARIVRYDTNHWKTWVHSRLAAHEAQAGSVSLFGTGDVDHRMLADHLTAERPQEVTAEVGRNRRTIIEWKQTSRDNHWLDCLVGCAVAASTLGLSIAGQTQPQQSRRQTAIDTAKKRGLIKTPERSDAPHEPKDEEPMLPPENELPVGTCPYCGCAEYSRGRGTRVTCKGCQNRYEVPTDHQPEDPAAEEGGTGSRAEPESNAAPTPQAGPGEPDSSASPAPKPKPKRSRKKKAKPKQSATGDGSDEGSASVSRPEPESADERVD